MTVSHKILFALWAAGALVLAGGSAKAEVWGQTSVCPSGCVRCHAHTGKGGVVYPEYIRWAASAHAAKNVGCEACHGGDANTDDKEKAHAGMLSPSSLDSPVSPKQVPQTCGRCHETEYQHYIQSKHYRKLQENEEGANCVTCHGSTAVSVPTAATVANTCKICHNPEKGINPSVPDRAFHTLIRLTEARGQLDLAQAAVLMARDRKQETADLERTLARCRENLDLAVRQWHTFDLGSVEKTTTDAYDLASQTRMLAERGFVGTVVFQGTALFWPVLFLVLLTAIVLLNVVVLLRLSRHRPA